MVSRYLLGLQRLETPFTYYSYGVDTALMRVLLLVSSHALFGVVMGFYLGKAKFSRLRSEKTWLALALGVPMTLHIIYNATLLLPGK